MGLSGMNKDKAKEQSKIFARGAAQDRDASGVRKLTVGDKVKKAVKKGAETIGIKKRPARATGGGGMSRPETASDKASRLMHQNTPQPKNNTSEDHSFDPGEASANVELPKDSFVSQVAAHLSGKRV
jgi:hypothetical protein